VRGAAGLRLDAGRHPWFFYDRRCSDFSVDFCLFSVSPLSLALKGRRRTFVRLPRVGVGGSTAQTNARINVHAPHSVRSRQRDRRARNQKRKNRERRAIESRQAGADDDYHVIGGGCRRRSASALVRRSGSCAAYDGYAAGSALGRPLRPRIRACGCGVVRPDLLRAHADSWRCQRDGDRSPRWQVALATGRRLLAASPERLAADVL